MMEHEIYLPGQVSAQQEQQAIEFWLTHKALPEPAARNRAPLLCGVSKSKGQILAVATMQAVRLPLTGLNMYLYRTFVAPEERQKGIAKQLFLAVTETYSQTFDRQQEETTLDPIGVAVVIPEQLAGLLDDHLRWPISQFSFIGKNEHGDHVRVRYFERTAFPGPRA